MKEIKYKIFFLLTTLLLSNCVTNSFYFTENPIKATAPTVSTSQAFLLWGIGQKKEIDATEACGKKKPVKASTKFTALDAILGICTFGIYTPRTVEIYCE